MDYGKRNMRTGHDRHDRQYQPDRNTGVFPEDDETSRRRTRSWWNTLRAAGRYRHDYSRHARRNQETSTRYGEGRQFSMIQVTRKYLLITGILGAVIMVVAGINYRITQHIVEKTIGSQQEDIAEKAADTVEIWLNQQMKILTATADSIDDQRIGPNDLTLKPLKMAMKAGHFTDVYIGRQDGLLIDGADWRPPAGYDPRLRPWFQRARETGHISFTTPYIDLVTNKLVIALVKPLFADGGLVGVMGADTVLDTLVSNVLNLRVGDSGYAFIVEKSGTIIVHPEQDYVMTARLQDIEPDLADSLHRFTSEDIGSIRYFSMEGGKNRMGRQGRPGRQYVLSFCNIENSDWLLCVTAPRDEAYSRIRKSTMIFATEVALKVLAILALGVVVIAGISGLAIFFFSRRYSTAVQQHQEEMVGINRDLEWNITRRKEVETYYKTLFNVANDGILICQGSHIVECNHKAEPVFGRSREEILTATILDISPAEQADGTPSHTSFTAVIEECRSSGTQIFRWTFQRGDGSEFPASVGVSLFLLDDKELTLLSVRDISKRVDAEGQLMQAQKMAAVGEMLGAIAHQWRQPLNTLSTYISSLQVAHYNAVLTREMVEKIVSGANEQIQFMSKTIDDFRNFFKPAKTKGPVDVFEAVISAVKLMQAQMRHNGISLTVKNHSGVHALIVYGYLGEFIHVLVNILANSKEAINERLEREPDAPRSIDILVTCRNEADGPGAGTLAVIEITDSGCGIPEPLLPKIFNPYYTTKGASSGTGMGLYMSKMIVEKEMDGDIRAENTGSGARFTITLKKMRQAEQVRTAATTAEATAAAEQGGAGNAGEDASRSEKGA